MASLFNKKPATPPSSDPYARAHISKEIEHLKKPASTRHLDGKGGRRRGGYIVILIALLIGLLYILDPIRHAWYRGNAIRDYLYLHRYGSDQKAQQLVDTGILAPSEAATLNSRPGGSQDDYPNLDAANRDADTIIHYMHGVFALQAGSYGELDPLDKVRYQLFVRFGLHPPTDWIFLDPAVHE